MLSKRHHILYWIVSFVSLSAQGLRQTFKEYLAIDNDTQAILDQSIASYAIWFCLLLIEKRTRVPPVPPNWQNQRPVNKKIWERAFMAVVDALVKRRTWFFELGTVLICLVVGDGALWLSGVGEEGEDVARGKIVRVLATFMFLGMVEPVWRNGEEQRADLQVRDLGVCARAASYAGAEGKVISLVTTVSVIGMVATTASVVMYAFTGEWLNVMEWWFPLDMKPHRVFVMLWLLSPLTDLSETIFYFVYWR
ncbi:hypothetical protein ACHAQJ_003881 [Trichoderma viride]